METTDEKRPFIASEEVPKRVIQIWLGAPPPPKVAGMMGKVRAMCEAAGWEYALFDDAEVAHCFGWYRGVRDLLARCGTVSDRSDVIRYLAVHGLGGLYLDADVDLYRLPEGLRGAWVWKSTDVSCNAAVLAAPMGGKFTGRLVEGLPGVKLETYLAAGPRYVTALVDSPDCPPVNLWAVRDWAGCRGSYGHHKYMASELGSGRKP